MSVDCILSSNKGDLIVYFGGVCYGDEVLDKIYVKPISSFPGGHYPIVRTGSGAMRVVHPNYYTISKIIRKKK